MVCRFGGHSTRVKGINVSGAVLLDLDIADIPPEELDAEQDIFDTATEFLPVHDPALAAAAEAGALPAGHQLEGSKPCCVTEAAAVSLAQAAQRAQTEHNEQNESDWISRFTRRDSEEGHGPFAGVPLQPKDGMHCISILVQLLCCCTAHICQYTSLLSGPMVQHTVSTGDCCCSQCICIQNVVVGTCR